MDNTTPKQFLQTLFPPDVLLPDERPVVAHPASFTSKETGKLVEYYRQFHPRGRIAVGELATYYCVSTVERQLKRQVKKRLEDVCTAMVLVLDDIGTKSVAPAIAPSYTIETSAGNFQWGYLLEPFDVTSPSGQAYYDSILYSLAEAGHNDPGFRSATRLARLPGSLHHTGFVAWVDVWHPDRVWDLRELAMAFEIPLKTPRKLHALKPGKYALLEDVEDVVYRWLVDARRVWGHNDCWVFIECPWRAGHTDGAQGPSSTAYSPRDYGRAGVGFKCLHGHCAGRDVADFMSWVMEQKNADNR